MIENTVILKILGSIVAVGATTGAGVYAYKSNLFNSSGSGNKYIIAKSVSHTPDANIGELYSGDENNKTQNFKCVLKETEQKIDESCKVKELTETDKHLDLILKTDTNTTAAANIKTNDKYYKIIVTDELLNAVTAWDGSKEIEVTQKATGGKIFGKLKLLYKVENGKVTQGKTNLLVVKAIPTEETSTTGTKCKIDDEKETASACSIYSFNPTITTFLKSKNDLKLNETAITEKNSLTDNSIFVIDLKTNKKDISSLNNKTIIYLGTDDQVVKKFSFISALSVEESFNATTSKPLILS